MEEFVSKLKTGATKVFESAEKITSNAISKTSTMVSKTKLNYAISANESKIKDIYAKLGKYVYDEYKAGSTFPDDIAEDLSTVETLYDEIDELKAKIADMENSTVCPECGAYNKNGAVYCSKCGEKLS